MWILTDFQTYISVPLIPLILITFIEVYFFFTMSQEIISYMEKKLEFLKKNVLWAL